MAELCERAWVSLRLVLGARLKPPSKLVSFDRGPRRRWKAEKPLCKSALKLSAHAYNSHVDTDEREAERDSSDGGANPRGRRIASPGENEQRDGKDDGASHHHRKTGLGDSGSSIGDDSALVVVLL